MMARFTEPKGKQQRHWRIWVSTRPATIRAIAERFDPWSLYRLKTTGQRVTVRAFADDGTVSVAVTGQFNAVLFDTEVFGINPDDLEPCDLPGPDDVLGAEMTQQDVTENLNELRVAVRPDLWVMGPDGIAKRRDN